MYSKENITDKTQKNGQLKTQNLSFQQSVSNSISPNQL